MIHHEVFHKFKCWDGNYDPGYTVNFLGVFTNKDHICSVRPECPSPRRDAFRDLKKEFIRTEYPPFCESYFEWISVLESVVQAKNKFTMIELGAGFGPHLVNAAAAIRSYHGWHFPYTLIGVEGEPTCFKWMQEHFTDNGIDPARHQLIEAVVTDKDGEVWFEVGFPRGYGSFIISPVRYLSDPARQLYRSARRAYKRIRGEECVAADYWTGKKGLGIYTKRTKAVSLNSLLKYLDVVDLIHLDIKGAEFNVLRSAREQLDAKVKRVHVGTHDAKTEKRLRLLFRDLRWKCLCDYPGRGERLTDYGKIQFADGVQTWINPKLLILNRENI